MAKLLLKKWKLWNKLIILIGFIGLSLSTYGQFYSGLQQEFGKNRIQYQDDRTWSFFRYKKFDTYFYQGGLPLAIYSSTYITQQIDAISKKLDYIPDQKVRVIIFNSLADLKESNIGLITEEQYNTGGVTHVIDNKIFVYFNGNHYNFEKQIREGIAQVMLNGLMYGGSTGAKVKNSILLSFPSWYTDGLVSYLAEGWSTEIDNVVRDGIASKRYRKFSRLGRAEQVYVGHSIWNYIDERYGSRAVSEIVYMAKVNRNIESGFLYVIGLTYKMLIQDWFAWYQKRYNITEDKEYTLPESTVLKRNKIKRVYDRPTISPDGKYVAYVRNEIGKVKVRIMDLETKRRKTIMKFGYKLDEKTDYSYPLIAWSPIDHYLTVIHEKQGKTEMITYNIDGGRPQKRFLLQFDKILDFSYNNRGNMMVMSAVKEGQSDIYLYFIGSNTFKRITYDIYDDEYPRFVNNSTAVIFSSNRNDDILRFDKKTYKNVIIDTLKGQAKHDLFFYEIKKKGNSKLRRITNTPLFDEIYPMPIKYNHFSWLSDESGVYNRYVGRFDSTISFVDTTTHYRYYTKYHAASNYSFGILDQDYNTEAGKYAELVYTKGHYKMFVGTLPDYEDYDEYKLTPTKYMAGILAKEKKRKQRIADARRRAIELKNNPEAAKKDSIAKVTEKKAPKKKKFQIIYIGKNKEKKDSNIDIDNYTFDGDSKTEKKEDNSPKYVNKEKAVDLNEKKNTDIYKSKLYYVEYSVSSIVTQVDFSSLNYSYQPFTNPKSPIYINPGFTGFLKLGVMDLFEDYRLTGGVRLSYNLKNNEYFASFKNLKKRLDKEIIFHRKVLQENQFDYGVNHMLHEGILRLSWPFDVVRSVRGSVLMRYDNAAYTSTNPYTATDALKKPNDMLVNGGLSLSFVDDNTRSPGLNLFYGTRYKIFAEYYQPLNELQDNLFVVGLDYRKYIKIFKTFIWANRLAASTSFGTQRLVYYMGSVDNWLFPEFNRNIQVDKEQNFIYQTLATNMRGFRQNIRNGNSFVAINSELRLPIFQFFSPTPLKSQFLQNFMTVGFFDIGTAWSGPDPFSDNNALFKQEVYQQPIKVTIINQNDPIVAGYGFGLRSKLFGYYVRADWAWGIENGRVRKKALFYLSFSLDF